MHGELAIVLPDSPVVVLDGLGEIVQAQANAAPQDVLLTIGPPVPFCVVRIRFGQFIYKQLSEGIDKALRPLGYALVDPPVELFLSGRPIAPIIISA